MKRLLVVLVLLIVVGGVCFYFGWLQIRLDEDSYGVVFTKTRGWEETVLLPGSFEWRAERLLPTNLSLHVFPLETQVFQTTLRGSLPAATTYAALLETSGAFSFAVTVGVSYQIDPERLPQLAKDDGLRAEGLSAYYSQVEAEIQQVVSESVTGTLVSTLPPLSASGAIRENLEEVLGRRFDALRILSVSVTRLDLPDLDLYEETKSRYTEVLDARTEALKAAALDQANVQAELDAGLERLERYGEILERYPILLDYFTLSQDNPGGPLDLEALIPVPPQ